MWQPFIITTGMKDFDIEKVYSIYTQLDKNKRKEILRILCDKGMELKAIEAFTYRETPSCKHLFFHFKDNNIAIPYYQLTEEQLNEVQEILLKINEEQL